MCLAPFFIPIAVLTKITTACRVLVVVRMQSVNLVSELDTTAYRENLVGKSVAPAIRSAQLKEGALQNGLPELVAIPNDREELAQKGVILFFQLWCQLSE